MNWWRLLWSMMVKELRTTLREKQQLFGLIGGLLVLLAVGGSMGYKLRHPDIPAPPPPLPAMTQPAPVMTQPAQSLPATQALAHPPRRNVAMDMLVSQVQVAGLRWACIAIGTGIGMFFSLGYSISATLASFAGEKDERTLEILLASPIPDTTLFLTKCLSVLLPMAAVGYVLLLAPVMAAALLLRQELSQIPIHALSYVLVLSVPILLLLQACLVAVGAAISAKAETLKGASQAFGLVFMIFFFGAFYGLPLLFSYTGLRGPGIAFAKSWLTMPFAAQYLIFLGVLALIAAALNLGARTLFRRDRLLG